MFLIRWSSIRVDCEINGVAAFMFVFKGILINVASGLAATCAVYGINQPAGRLKRHVCILNFMKQY